MTDAHIVRRSCGRPAMQIVGQRFTRLVVIERAPTVDQRSRWRCRCDCGNVIVTLGKQLRDGDTRSCGCLRADLARANGKRAALAAKIEVGARGRSVPAESGEAAKPKAKKRSKSNSMPAAAVSFAAHEIAEANQHVATLDRFRGSLNCGLFGDTPDKREARNAVVRMNVSQHARIASATASVFRAPHDTVHVDRPGARVVRGSRY